MNSCKNRTFIAYVLPTKLWRNKTFYGSMSIFVCMGMLKFLWVIMIFYCFYTILDTLLHQCIRMNTAYRCHIFLAIEKMKRTSLRLENANIFVLVWAHPFTFHAQSSTKKVGKIFFPINIRGIFYRVQIIMHWPISI